MEAHQTVVLSAEQKEEAMKANSGGATMLKRDKERPASRNTPISRK